MKSKKTIANITLITFFVLLVTALTLPSALSAAHASENNSDIPSEQLTLISEITGYRAVLTPLSEECTYDSGFEVHLCEESGSDITMIPNPLARAQALQTLNSTGLLLIPDSTNDRIMAFDPLTGDLIDSNFVPSNPVVGTGVHAILSVNATILLSDQTGDVVHEFDLDGNYLGIFAPAGGANTDILDNIRGMALQPDGTLLVTVAAGPNANAIAAFDTSGNYLGNFISNGSGGLNSPFDVYQRPGVDWLVGGIESDLIHRYHLDSGAFLANLAAIDSFPEQIYQAANSNVLVANFSGTQQGVVEFTAAGELVGVYNPADITGYRGVYELPNGNLLTTTGAGVHEIDRSGNLVQTKISDISGRFIEYVAPNPQIELTKTVGLTPGICADTNEIIVTAGSEVTYCYTVENTGNIALSIHDLVDSELGVLLDTFNYFLAPGASVFLTQEATINVTTVNTATWTANSELSDYAADDTIPFNWEDISGTGTPVTLSDDQVSNAIPLGFDFNYYEDDYNEIFISSNGFLTVLPGQPNGCCTGGLLPDPTPPNGTIAGWWEDLNPNLGGSIHFQTLGTAPDRYFIVQFTDIPHFGGGNLVTKQYKLFEGSNFIEMHYQSAPSDGGTHSAGIENATGISGVQYYRGTEGLPTPLAVRYSRVPLYSASASDSATVNIMVFDLELTPTDAALSGEPGDTVGYTLTLTNLGNVIDIFEITFQANEWDVLLPLNSFELAVGESVDVSVHVTIPANATDGDTDTVTITATSTGGTDVSANALLTTTAEVEEFFIYLPVALKN